MLDPSVKSEVLRLFYAEHFTMNAIADALGIHHDTVKALIDTKQFSKARPLRPSKLDPYRVFIESTVNEYPKIRATRVLQMIKSRGYQGSISILRRCVKRLRPSKGKGAFLVLDFLPGEQAQVDWAHFGKLRIENTERPLYCFVMVLAFSRAMYARFCFDMSQESFQRRHIEAFRFFGGIARKLLYDNLKSVVIERFGKDLRLNRQHLDFAGYYHFKPEACAVRAGWQKGRVERSIRYIRDNFFAARSFSSLDDANCQLLEWLQQVANKRSWPDDRAGTVWDKWQEEKTLLMKLPDDDYDTDTLVTTRAVKYPLLRFDKNDYSIPFEYVGKPMTVRASDEIVRIFCDNELIATHDRSFGKGLKIRNPEHVAGLLASRPKGFSATLQDTLVTLIPECAELIGMLIEEGQPTGRHIHKIMELIEEYGVSKVAEIIKIALKNHTPRASTLAQMLAFKARSEKLTPLPDIILPDRPGVRDLEINIHDLATYDELSDGGGDENDNQP